MYYETVFIVNPDVSQENTHKLADSLVARVEKSNGRIVKREYWGSRPLAYTINKRKRGHYLLLVTDGAPAALQELERALRLDERVIRFQSILLDEISEVPSPVIRHRQAKVRSDAEQQAAADLQATAEQAAAEQAAAGQAAAEQQPAAESEQPAAATAAAEAVAE